MSDEGEIVAGGGTSVPRRRDDLAAIELDGDVVVYDAASDAMHIFNATAALVWQCLDGTASVEELGDELSAAFAADAATVRADVHAAIAVFAERGLLDTGETDLDEEVPATPGRAPAAPQVLAPAPST